MEPFITDSYADQRNTHPCMDSHPIQWTADTGRPAMEHMRIDHRRFDIAMSQQLLNSSNVRAAFKWVRGKGMAERMARGSFCKTGHHHGLSDGFLYQGFVNMMATLFLSPHIAPAILLGKHPLPAPVLWRVGGTSGRGRVEAAPDPTHRPHPVDEQL